MITHDDRGREYAKVSELQPGDTVLVDARFKELTPWVMYKISKGRKIDDLLICYTRGIYRLLEHLEQDNDTIAGMYRVDCNLAGPSYSILSLMRHFPEANHSTTRRK